MIFSYSQIITKPPEGLGVRLVSVGPLLFLGAPAMVLAVMVACNPVTLSPEDSTAHSFVQLHSQVQIIPTQHTVRVQGHVACTQGFLEQMVCGRGSREHESLVVIDAPASVVHAAMLAAGMRAGKPGSWHSATDGVVQLVSPTGDVVQVLVQWQDETGEHQAPLSSWLINLSAGSTQPIFVFAGSAFVPNKQGAQRYLADDSGSVVGLVTFGDEVIAMREVVPDKVQVSAARWKARTSVMPVEGAAVTVILRAQHSP